MKANLTVSVDAEVLAIAKTKTDNMSGYVNECLVSLADMPEPELPDDKDELKRQLAQTTKALAELRLKITEKEKEERETTVIEL